jgi:hypothetical protein
MNIKIEQQIKGSDGFYKENILDLQLPVYIIETNEYEEDLTHLYYDDVKKCYIEEIYINRQENKSKKIFSVIYFNKEDFEDSLNTSFEFKEITFITKEDFDNYFKWFYENINNTVRKPK